MSMTYQGEYKKTWTSISKEGSHSIIPLGWSTLCQVPRQSFKDIFVSNVMLFRQTNILVFGEETDKDIRAVKSSLAAHNISFEALSGNEANQRYPRQLNLPSSFACVLERDGGILSAPDVMKAFHEQFFEGGGVLWENCPVTDIIPGSPVIKLTTSRGQISAKKLVLTVGPWAPKWLKSLDISIQDMKVSRSEVYYWKVAHPEDYAANNFPVFLYYHDSEFHYGLPIFEHPGMIRVGLGGPEVPDPDHCNANPTTEYKDSTANVLAKYFKFVSTESSIDDACLATKIEDENPILDRHPKYPNIVIGAGMSGHGFKLAPVIGKILCELVLDLPASYDLTPFKLHRNI